MDNRHDNHALACPHRGSDRTDGPLPAYSLRRGAAAPRPRRRPRAAPRRARGRCPPRKAAKRPKRRPSRPKSGPEEKRSPTDGPEERMGALRPGLRRLRGSREHAGGSERLAGAARALRASLRGGGVCCAREPRPGASPRPSALGQTDPCRPTAPAAARRSHHRALAGPELPRRGRAAARGPRHPALGVDVRRGRPPRGRKDAPAGQNRAQRRNALRQTVQRNAWAPSGRV
jgi:hypothetical protein